MAKRTRSGTCYDVRTLTEEDRLDAQGASLPHGCIFFAAGSIIKGPVNIMCKKSSTILSEGTVQIVGPRGTMTCY